MSLLVVGSAVYDITGHFLSEEVSFGDSNPSNIYTGCGGVGRNIAENAARIGLATGLITTWGTDVSSAELRASCENVGVDVSRVYVCEGSKPSIYINLLDSRGELLLAAADLAALEAVPTEVFTANTEYINRHKLVCLDANLVEDQLLAITAGCRVTIIGETVSSAKAPRFRPVLKHIHTLKTNAAELAALTGRSTAGRRDIISAAQELLAAGVERVYVTQGEHGACCIDRQGSVWIGGIETCVTSVTGVGDAFAVGVAYGMLRGLSPADTLLFGTAMSHITLRSPSAVSGDINETTVLRLKQKLEREASWT